MTARTPLTLPGLAALASGALVLGAAPARAADGDLACSASGPSVSVLGQAALSPSSVGSASAPCARATAGIGDLLHPTPLVDVDALAASTDLTGGAAPRTQVASASGGVLAARVGSLSSLGLPLEALTDRVVLPPALQTVRVPLPTQLTSALTPVIALQRLLNPALATQLSSLVADGLTFDTRQLVRDVLVLPQADLLDASAVTARASARCVDGATVLEGSHAVAPVRALGQVVDTDTPVGQLLPVTGTTLDLTRLDLSTVQLPSVLSGLGLDALLGGVLTTVQQSVVRQLQDAVPAGGIALPADLVRLDVTPGSEERTATSLTERALRLRLSVAGREVADVQGGTATVDATGVDCAEPAVAPPATPPDPPAATTPAAAPPAATTPEEEPAPATTAAAVMTAAPATTTAPVVPPVAGSAVLSGTAPSTSAPAAATAASQLLLQCSERRLVLTNVLQRPDRVALFGVADRALAGRTVTIRFRASGRDVATAVVAPDGSFKTTAPLPSRAVRATNAARYQARIGSLTSLDLKLRRRMVVQRIDQADGRVTVRGHVDGPFPAGGATVLLTRRVSCSSMEPLARVKADAHGDYVVTVAAPAGESAVVYRLQSKVRRAATSKRTSRTYTLPQGIDIAR